jgi:polyhydroxyalkanoate synthesis regulator phasin
MKTYLLDSIDRFKRYSQSLDVKTILCSKVWYVLNEDGDTENLIFQEDGNILVSINGCIKKLTWQYIPQNKSLNIMHTDTEGIMLKPAFIDGKVLAFQKPGTKECMFLIDDSVSSHEKILSLDSIKNYLDQCEQEALRIEKELANQLLQEQKRMGVIEQQKIDEIKNKIEIYECECKDLDEFYRSKGLAIYEACNAADNSLSFILLIVVSIVVISIVIVVIIKIFEPNIPNIELLEFGSFFGVILGTIFATLFDNSYLDILIKYRKHALKIGKPTDSLNYKYIKSVVSAYEEYTTKKNKLLEQENEIDKLRKQLKELEDQ